MCATLPWSKKLCHDFPTHPYVSYKDEIRKKSNGVVVDVINVEQNIGVQCLFCRLFVVIMEEFGEYWVDGCSGFSIDQIYVSPFFAFLYKPVQWVCSHLSIC